MQLVTHANAIIGAEYDLPAVFPVDAAHPWTKLQLAGTVARELKNAKNADADALDIAWWEVGLLRFSPVPSDNGPYLGQSYEDFAQSFGITDATVSYAEERATETKDIVLRIHYLAFTLSRMPPSGRAWIERQREVVFVWKEFIESSRDSAAADTQGFVGLSRFSGNVTRRMVVQCTATAVAGEG